MTIRQLPACCYVFKDPAEGPDERHYDDLQDASADLIEARKNNPETKATTTHLTDRCWIVECDGECGRTLDLGDEGVIIHHESFDAAEKTALSYGFRLAPGLLGQTLAWCMTDAPEDAEVPPPTPAEQEAAGQQRLPGIVP